MSRREVERLAEAALNDGDVYPLVDALLDLGFENAVRWCVGPGDEFTLDDATTRRFVHVIAQGSWDAVERQDRAAARYHAAIARILAHAA
jgi:hypothetical protein